MASLTQRSKDTVKNKCCKPSFCVYKKRTFLLFHKLEVPGPSSTTPLKEMQAMHFTWYVRHMVVLLDIDSEVAPNDKARREFQETHSADATVATKASPRQIGKSWKG